MVLGELAELGAMDIAWAVLDAQWFGLAQRRKRVFVVVDFGGQRAGEILLEPESVRGNPPPRREAGARPASTLGGGAPGRGRRDNPDTAELIPEVAWALQERDAKGADSDTKDGHLISVADPICANEARTYTHEGRGNFRLRNVVQGVRRLMPLECERLQGFPDQWTEGFADSTRYRMLGNAVAVPVAEWIGRRICASSG